MKKTSQKDILSWAKEVVEIEAAALAVLKKSLNSDFTHAVGLLYQCRGRIVVTGMGKGGIIGQKFSATLSSTGTSSFWLHAAEAVHGDLGRIKNDDVVVVLSYSGETEEIRNLVPFVEKIGARIVAITGKPRSFLGRYADCVIDAKIDKEACALGLAPTTSTTVMLAICDAISVVLMKMKRFNKRDFASFHPRGSLGRKILKVRDIMRRGKFNPVVSPLVPVKEVLAKVTGSSAGAAAVVDKNKKLVGIFTDGDLRRSLQKHGDILNKKVIEVMTKNPVVVKNTDLVSRALNILETKKIDEVPVVDKNCRLVGMLDVQDLIAAGII